MLNYFLYKVNSIVPDRNIYISVAINHKFAIITIFIKNGLKIFHITSFAAFDQNAIVCSSHMLCANDNQITRIARAFITFPAKTTRTIHLNFCAWNWFHETNYEPDL